MQANSPGPSRVPNNHIQVQIEKENFVVACFSPPKNVKLGISVSRRSDSKEMYQKA